MCAQLSTQIRLLCVAGLLAEHAKELVALSFDAMAVTVGDVMLWSNAAFNGLAESLGDGNTKLGAQIMQNHFFKVLLV